MSKVTKEEIDAFLNGTDPMERIIKIECGYDEEQVSIIYRNEKGEKRIKKDDFKPFVWTKVSTAQKLFNGNRKELRKQMDLYDIECIGLRVNRDDGTIPERMEHGYRLMFRAKKAMKYNRFLDFFVKAGKPIFGDKKSDNSEIREYMVASPVEQYMIQTGKRMFKGYNDYDDLLRMEWDLETEGLDPNINAISQIGIRTNKGYEKIITVDGQGNEKWENEFNAICEFFEIIRDIQPDIITGHNTENFDWNFIDVRLRLRDINMGIFSKEYFRKGVYKKKKYQMLKLGGEVEQFYPTSMWGTNLTDSLFAVRRAQAIDSNIKSANLKYITKYSGLNKPNRVYVPGKEINTIWEDLNKNYAFNNENGRWFKVTDKILSKALDNSDELRYTKENEKLIDKQTNELFDFVSGRYIVQRYLLDDLWETDKVELQYNQSNFLVSKMLPTQYEKVCTMGTAAIWKFIMLAWSYEKGLGIPELVDKINFTGGLSRLLRVSRVSDIVKLDFNSLYPSIILTYNIKNDVDITDVLLAMLEYVLSMREYYKQQKAIHGENVDNLKRQLENAAGNESLVKELKNKIAEEKVLKNQANTMQLPLKILGNSYFGGSSSGRPFPWTGTNCVGAEQTTCTGRQMLRLMICHFSNIGTKNGLNEDYNYIPVVGDSFTSDTPLFVKYDDTNLIDIKPISELIDECHTHLDVFGREYDYSNKNFKVLCRHGWMTPNYIYRHSTSKPIYRVEDGNGCLIDVTEDHSVFDSNKNKINPSEIDANNTKLEYYEYDDVYEFNSIVLTEEEINVYALLYKNGRLKVLPTDLLNSTIECKNRFLEQAIKKFSHNMRKSKTLVAGELYLSKCITNRN